MVYHELKRAINYLEDPRYIKGLLGNMDGLYKREVLMLYELNERNNGDMGLRGLKNEVKIDMMNIVFMGVPIPVLGYGISMMETYMSPKDSLLDFAMSLGLMGGSLGGISLLSVGILLSVCNLDYAIKRYIFLRNNQDELQKRYDYIRKEIMWEIKIRDHITVESERR